MSRIAYVNGRFQRHDLAAVHIEDRGFQFADAIYEVWAVRKGELLDAEGHFDRLDRSLGELRIAHPVTRAALTIVIRELIRRNRIGDGLVYLQISRGRARRGAAAVMIRNVMIRNVMTLVMVCNLTHSTYVGLCSTDVVQQDPPQHFDCWTNGRYLRQ